MYGIAIRHIFWCRLPILAKIALNLWKAWAESNIHGWANLIHGWKKQLWMSSMDGGTSSIDKSVICGCHPWMETPHPWMKMRDYGHGRSICCKLIKRWLTWAISTSPKGSKYSLNSGSVVFQGSPSTIKSEHLFFSTLLFLATELSVWSSDFLLSAVKKRQKLNLWKRF